MREPTDEEGLSTGGGSCIRFWGAVLKRFTACLETETRIKKVSAPVPPKRLVIIKPKE
jgi:hypothetical protein